MDVKIQSNENEKMEEICQKFCTKMEKEINNICFFYSGKQINFQLKFNEVSKIPQFQNICIFKLFGLSLQPN